MRPLFSCTQTKIHQKRISYIDIAQNIKTNKYNTKT